jgi:UDP-GlcNAc:undecaprenyl-phosphate GlcNAc-1-phosphate transferase
MLFELIAFPPFLLAFAITLLLTPCCIFLLKRFNIVDDPQIHKHPAILHTKPIPRGGGIALYIGILISAYVFLPFTQITIALFFSSLLALIVGVLDDKYDLSPYLRFFMNIVVASIVVMSGVTIPFVTNPLGGIFHMTEIGTFIPLFIPIQQFLPGILAIIWIVWVMNMLNWSNGIDGQMPGILTISAVVIGIVSLRFPLSDQNTYIAALLSFMIAGAALGFLPFNFYPAKIFLGYGATSIYLLLAVVSILSGAKLATALLVMGVPMIDGIFTIGRRILQGHSPFWHDKKHLHHLLLNLGFGQRRVALFYWLLSAILGVLALSLSSRGKVFALIMILLIIGGTLFSLHKVTKAKNEKEII